MVFILEWKWFPPIAKLLIFQVEKKNPANKSGRVIFNEER
jgi:hypothetical protein